MDQSCYASCVYKSKDRLIESNRFSRVFLNPPVTENFILFFTGLIHFYGKSLTRVSFPAVS